jgi:hypothetical protein
MEVVPHNSSVKLVGFGGGGITASGVRVGTKLQRQEFWKT